MQDLALKESDSIFDLIWNEKAHIYVCGDVTMAEHVYQTLRRILATKQNKTESEMEKYMLSLRVSRVDQSSITSPVGIFN